jgi:hypothetical protein
MVINVKFVRKIYERIDQRTTVEVNLKHICIYLSRTESKHSSVGQMCVCAFTINKRNGRKRERARVHGTIIKFNRSVVGRNEIKKLNK